MKVLIEGSRLVNILKAVSIDKEIEIVELNFTEKGLVANNMNEAQHILSYCIFRPEFFIEYQIPEPKSITVNVNNILKPLNFHKSKKISISISKDELICFETDAGDRIWSTNTYLENKTTLEMMDLPFGKVIRQETLDPSEYSYAEIAIPKSQISTLVNPLGEDTVTILIDSGRLKLQQASSGMYGTENVISTVVKNPKPMKVHVSSAYLRKALGVLISKKAILAIAPNRPIIISEKTTDYEIHINIAPKYEIEEIYEEIEEEEIGGVEVDVGE